MTSGQGSSTKTALVGSGNVSQLINSIQNRGSPAATRPSVSVPNKPPPPVTAPAPKQASASTAKDKLPTVQQQQQPPPIPPAPIVKENKEETSLTPPSVVDSKKKTRRSRKSKFRTVEDTQDERKPPEDKVDKVQENTSKVEIKITVGSKVKESTPAKENDKHKGSKVVQNGAIKEAKPITKEDESIAKPSRPALKQEKEEGGAKAPLGPGAGQVSGVAAAKPRALSHVPLRANVSRQSGAKRGTMGAERCEECGERVYLMERLGVENRVFHRTCFKCHTCHIKLKAGSYEYDTHTDRFYCRQHYREALRNQTISRVMAEKGLTYKEDSDVKRKSEDKTKKTSRVVADSTESAAKKSAPPPSRVVADNRVTSESGLLTSKKAAPPQTMPAPPPLYSSLHDNNATPATATTAAAADGSQQPQINGEGINGEGSNRSSPLPVKPPRRRKQVTPPPADGEPVSADKDSEKLVTVDEDSGKLISADKDSATADKENRKPIAADEDGGKLVTADKDSGKLATADKDSVTADASSPSSEAVSTKRKPKRVAPPRPNYPPKGKKVVCVDVCE